MNNILYTHKISGRAKYLRVTVGCDGAVVVTSPYWLGQSIIEKFISDKSQWIINKIRRFQGYDGRAIRSFTRADYVRNKARAHQLVSDRIHAYKQMLNYSFNNVSIRDQKTRWGSCSNKKNLSFNYKIVFLNQKQQDYIVVHELCHLKELNHSKKFWGLVQSALPDYVEIRNSLRHHKFLVEAISS